MSSQRKAIAAEEWERHKQAITDLYSEKSLKDVMAEMEKRHGFKASAYQYETQLRTVWGIRKNTKRSEWAALFQQFDDPESTQRTPAGREKPPNSFKRARRYLKATQSLLPAQPSTLSRAPPGPPSPEPQDATASREVISPVRIENESSYGVGFPFDFGDTIENTGARLPSPGQATVTGQASLTSMQPWDLLNDPVTSDLTRPATGSPFDFNFHFGFENTFGNPGTGILSPGWAVVPGEVPAGNAFTLGPIDFGAPGDSMLSGNHNRTFDVDDNIHLAPTGLSCTMINDQNHSFQNPFPQGYSSGLQVDLRTLSAIELPIRSKISFPSHFTGFEKFLHEKGVGSTQPGRTGSGSWSPLSRKFTSRLIAEVILSKQQSLTRGASDLEKALIRLDTLMPEESTVLTTKEQAVETKFTRVLLFSMLNGFAGLGDIPVENMLNFLGRLSIISRSFLVALKACSTPAARTFVDTIFRASIEAKDDNALQLLLEHGLVDVNAIVCFSHATRYTPIERASRLQAYSLIPILLRHGANVNKTRGGGGGALTELLAGLHITDHTFRITPPTASITATLDITKTIDLLVKAGARVTVDNLEKAGRLFTTYDVACRLSDALHPLDHQLFFKDRNHGSIIAKVARYSDDKQASIIIRNILNLCVVGQCGTCLVACARQVEYAAIEAAERGHLNVIQLLINHVPSPSKILIAAIRSNSKVLIDFVLSLNPDLDPPAHFIKNTTFEEDATTPLAEAVKLGNKDLIRYLHSAGAFARLDKGNRMKPLILAAAHWGEISFMRQLLSYSDSSFHPYRAPSLAIEVALQNGHEQVAWLLLGSGAVSDCISFDASSLSLALQSQNKSLVHAILSADISRIGSEQVEEAFKWGDTFIISDLTSVCPQVDMGPVALRTLCQRCAQDDNTTFFRNFIESISLSHNHKTLLLEGCLEIAVGMGHSEMVCYLLDIGANPFTQEVLKAALPGHKEMLCLLFDKIRQRRSIPKCIGAYVLSSVMDESLGNPQALDALLETQAVNLRAAERLYDPTDELERDAFTPLGLALISLLKTLDKDPWMVRALLDAGSDPNGVARSAIMKMNYTGLMLALETTKHEIVQLLIDKGANINLKPRLAVKRTPLQYAAELGHLDMVRMLLEKGAEVNAEPAIRGGGTALQFAAISGNCNIANELLANGALLGALPSRVDGRWPLEGAAEHGRLDMIQLLWTAAVEKGGSDVVAGFQRRHCLRAMNFARENGHMGCRDLISELSGIPVERLDVEDYGAPWLAYSDLSHSSPPSDWDMLFSTGSSEWAPHR